ncbi:MAG: hypothetical protein U0946_06970, partial [Patescibacteria group bacterium]|nr:hypothetical protein [Patescibacteria group bacterium]
GQPNRDDYVKSEQALKKEEEDKVSVDEEKLKELRRDIEVIGDESKKDELNFVSNDKEKPTKSHFERNERPKYRYFCHGTFRQLADNIIKKDSFVSKEHYPNLTLSPIEGFRFLDRLIKKKGNSLKTRFRHLDPEDRDKIDLEKLSDDDCVVLVIEPTEEYKAYSTSEGRPNFFSTPDQIPDDIAETVRTRVIWEYHQHAMSKEPIAEKNKGDIRYPGIHPDYKRLPNGEWAKLEKEKQITVPLELPESSIKMVINKEPEFLRIFQDMEKDIDNRKEIDLAPYRKRIAEYLRGGQGITKRESIDEDELADNMVTGELEYYIVSAIRNLYLDLERYKGKKFIDWKTNKEEDRPVKTKEQFLDQIDKLRSIEPENEIFRKY